MNEAKRAAVVKRGGERDHRDLFASRPADLGSVKQTLRPPPPDASLGVAARNESSVLFTVDALRSAASAGAARVKTPEPEFAPPVSSTFTPSDDEGIIDLKSLSSAPPKVGARSVAPLFASETPPAAFAADIGSGVHGAVGSSPNGFKFGKRAIAGLAAAAVAVVLCSIGLAAAFKGEEPVVHAANAVMAPRAPIAALPAAPVVAAPATPAPETASAASSTSSDDDEKPVKKGKGRKAGKGTKVPSSGVVASKRKSEPLVSKPTPKPVDKCGCKGDFTCILRCTAKGS